MLVANQLNKSFAKVQAVEELSLRAKPGEILAMLGPNGAGKTTTLRMLVGLAEPDSGQIQYTGGNGNLSPYIPPQELGYLPEERGLYVDSKVIDGLLYFAQLRGLERADADAAARHWLERFELSDRATDLVKTLSKGNQQKVQLISAFIHRPGVAIVDEPFSGFDPINQEKVLRLIAELRDSGTCIIFSAHQMDLVQRVADRIILMSKGRAVAQGTMADIQNHSGLRSQIVAKLRSPIDASVLDNAPAPVSVDRLNLTMTVAKDQQVSDLVRWICERVELTDISTSSANLHDMYLALVEERS